MLAMITGLAGLLWGTVTDFRTREVPDWINFGLIGAGLGFSSLAAVVSWSFLPFLASLAGLAAGYLLGAAMYYTGQWGGGDAKMMMGLGALLGLPVTAVGWSQTPLFALFLVSSVFVGAAYGVIWMAGLVVLHRKKVFPALKERLHEPRILRWRIVILVAGLVLVLIGFAFPLPIMILFLVLAALTYMTFYLALIVKVVERVCFVKEVPVSRLVEGDWLVGEIKRADKVLVPAGNPGLTKEQLADLKRHRVRTVQVKEGIPFVPSFLIAYLLAYWWSISDWSLVALLL